MRGSTTPAPLAGGLLHLPAPSRNRASLGGYVLCASTHISTKGLWAKSIGRMDVLYGPGLETATSYPHVLTAPADQECQMKAGRC